MPDSERIPPADDHAHVDREARHVITVRLPRQLHQQLIREAAMLTVHRGRTVSMNSVCVWKLQKQLDALVSHSGADRQESV